MLTGMTFDEALHQWSTEFSDHIAIRDAEHAWSYTELYRKSLILAGMFRRNGIQKQDIVMIQLTNTVWFTGVFFALCRVGAVPVLCLPAHKALVIEGICKNAKPSAMIFTRNYLKYDYQESARHLAETYHCRLWFEDMLTLSSQEEADFLAQELKETDLPSAEDIAFLSLSGGTTGIILPAAHNFALGTPGIIGTLMKGGTVIMQKYPDISEFFSNIEKYGVTITSLVPSLVSMCLRYRKLFREDDISTLQYVMVGGAMFRSEDARLLEQELSCIVIQVFGMSEGMTFLTDINAPEEVRYFCQGKPAAPSDEFRIVDADFHDVPDGEAGEIIVRGAYTIKGYYQNPETNRTSFGCGGYYLTGDKAVREKNGNIRILGRIREQINRAGEKIMPSALEEWVCGHPAVNQCAAVGVPDKELGSKICVFITADTPVRLPELVQFLKSQNIPDFYLPDMLRQVDALPLTPVGKTDKQALLAMLTEEESA